eukprot:jgi/Mesvir1/2542/Mv26338-RA.1
MPLMDSPLNKTSLQGTIEVTTGIAERRGDVRASFNFYLPISWTAEGPATFCFVPTTSGRPTFVCHEQDGDGDCCISVNFVVKNPPCLRFVKVLYRENNEIKAVSDQVLREQYRRFRSMLPAPSDFPAEFVQFEFVYESRPPLRIVNNALDAARVLDDLAGRQTRVTYQGLRCWYIGVLKGIGGGLADFNGETATYYVGRAEATMSCGYDRNRGIHEFAHCLGIDHTTFVDPIDGKTKTSCSDVDNEGPAYPYNNYLVEGDPLSLRPTLGPMGSHLTEIWGVDPQLVGAGGPSYLVHVSPRAVFSLLSYCQQATMFGCQGRFMDKNTYTRMSSTLSERAVLGPLELGSDTPRDLSLFRGTIVLTGGSLTVTLGPLFEVCAKDNAETKANRGTPSGLSLTVQDGVTNPKVDIRTSDQTADMIADLLGCNDPSNPLCAKQLPFSPNSQDGWPYFSFDGFPAFSFDAFTFGSFDGFTFGSFDAFPFFSFDGFTFFSFDGFTFLSFDGFPISDLPDGLRVGSTTIDGKTYPFIDFEGFELTFPPVLNDFQGTRGATSDGPPNGTTLAEFTVAMGSVLKQTQGQVLPQSGPGTITISVDFDLEQRNILQLTLSANAPAFEATNPVYKPALVGGQKPVFDASTPKVDLCWAARDPDGQSLTFSVQYCPDFATRGVGCSCETLLLSYVDPSPAPCEGNPGFNCFCVAFDKIRLRASADTKFRVYASDGLRGADAFSISFEVANNPPNVQIVSPKSDMIKIVPSLLMLLGTADDVEDVTVPDWACQWVVNKNGTGFAYDSGAGKELAISTQTIRQISQHLVPLVNCRAMYDFEFSCSDQGSARGVATTPVVLYEDFEPPILFCPTVPGTRVARPGECVAGVSWENATAVDNCGGPVDIERVLGGPSGSDFPVGITLVRYRAADQFTRNVAECSIPVVVVDQEPPVLTCPADMEVGEDEPVVYNLPTATDNCGGFLSAVTQPGAPPSGSVFAPGVTLVVFSALDAAGNVGRCSMRVRCCSALLAGMVVAEQAMTIGTQRKLARADLHLLELQMIALTGLGDLNGCAVKVSQVAHVPGAGVQRYRLLVQVYAPNAAEAQADMGLIRQVVESGELATATFPEDTDPVIIIIEAPPGSCNFTAGEVTPDNDISCTADVAVSAEITATIAKCSVNTLNLTAMATSMSSVLDMSACALELSFFSVTGAVEPPRRRQLLQQNHVLSFGLVMFVANQAQGEAIVNNMKGTVEMAMVLALLEEQAGDVLSANATKLTLLQLASATSDPHFVTPHGSKFDFNGVAGRTYCIVTDKRLQVNARFAGAAESALVVPTDASEGKPDARTWMDQVAIQYGNDVVLVEAASPPATPYALSYGTVRVNGELLRGNPAAKKLPSKLNLKRTKTRVVVTIPKVGTIELQVVRAAFWQPGAGPGRNFLNLQMKQFTGLSHAHGILGQSFGAVDGDGATIKGNPQDYETTSILATDCVYNQFARAQE